jgi:hypothetical protein
VKFILNLVHHNPGEPPFESAFLEPSYLVDFGYNGQVFKHINCIATYSKLGVDVFPQGSEERRWLDGFTPPIEKQIAAAKAKGLSVFYHLDLFVLPKRLVEHFKDEVCDAGGRISLDKPKTLEIHAALFDELTERFPQVDGYIIRVGETYLFDTPHHQGNGPIPRGAKNKPAWGDAQINAYVKLINFLREKVCTGHDRYILFRTWDTAPDKLHARPDHYLQVTGQIDPHPKLLFSIKHTALDFWRRVKVNECIGIGNHPQVIEVQCQREYEGKGAYPNYVMDGVINGFEENARPIGLKDLLRLHKVQGVFGWARGGGWFGPYIKDEFWPDLNAWVLAQFASDPTQSEEELFRQYAQRRMGLAQADVDRFRELCVMSARAILLGRYCESSDHMLEESRMPTGNWMRDDRLGGRKQLTETLKVLFEHDGIDEALKEKADAVELWGKIAKLAKEIHWPQGHRWECVQTGIEYGRLLFSIVQQGWRILIAGYRGEKTGQFDRPELADALRKYDALWKEYRELGKSPTSASLYKGVYLNMPGTPAVPGLDESVDQYRPTL